MKLYGHENSGHAYIVALALSLADINHKYERVDITAPRQTRSESFLSASRWAEVPCLLITNQEVMVQSGAILLWIPRQFDVLGGRKNIDKCAEWINWEANRIGMCIPQLIQAQTEPEAVNMGAQEWLRARYEIDIIF